jgi:hypothetical protein
MMTLEGFGEGETFADRDAEAVLVALGAIRGTLTMLTPPLEMRNWGNRRNKARRTVAVNGGEKARGQASISGCPTPAHRHRGPIVEVGRIVDYDGVVAGGPLPVDKVHAMGVGDTVSHLNGGLRHTVGHLDLVAGGGVKAHEI